MYVYEVKSVQLFPLNDKLHDGRNGVYILRTH